MIVAVLLRLYAYPKMIVPALGLWVCWRYLERLSTARLVALGHHVRKRRLDLGSVGVNWLLIGGERELAAPP